MSFDDDDFWSDLQDHDPAQDPITASLSPAPSRGSSEPAPKVSRSRKRHAVPDGQLDLLSDFWSEDQEEVAEQERIHEFFKPKLSESSRSKPEGGVSRKVNVGLYRSDAELLEELFKQSKKAGLKNVSRARILRVALRHFHTCWLNRADD